jgi:hypothetical protein
MQTPCISEYEGGWIIMPSASPELPCREFLASQCDDVQLCCSIVLVCQVHLINPIASPNSFKTHRQSVTCVSTVVFHWALFVFFCTRFQPFRSAAVLTADVDGLLLSVILRRGT